MANNITTTEIQQEKNIRLLEWAERIIQQRQYETMESLTPRSVDAVTIDIHPGDVTCLFRVTELVFSREEGSLNRLSTVLNALHAAGASCLMLLQCQNGRSELYLGAVNKQRYDNVYYMNTIRDILRTGVEGNLPGTELSEIVSRHEIENKLAQCLDNGFDSQCITAVSCVAGGVDDGAKSCAGIENLLEAVGRQNFTLMVLADPVGRDQLRAIRKGYEDLSTQLSSTAEMSVSVQSGKSSTLSENFSETLTQTVGKSIALTQSHTSGSGWSKGSSTNSEEMDGKAKIGKLATSIAALALPGEASAFALNMVSSLFVNPVQSGSSDSTSGSVSDTYGRQESENSALAQGTNRGTGKTLSSSEGITVQTSTRDRHSKELLDRVEWYLTWLNRCENYGMFNCCAYVISSSAGLNLMVASQYQALMQGKGELSQPVTINTWTRENGAESIKQFLMHMQHPILQCDDLNEGLTPAMLMSSKELSRQMALPQHSVVGVSVMEYASFGREVVRKTPLRRGKVLRVGTISHMGKTVAHQPVLLDMQSMAAHTFIAGTNGSGKSNTVFRILEELMNASIPFMVIEPAKGEYKNVFGREPNVKVYGTNSRKTELLRLNPFWFNEDVDVLEHIDKLIDVFNASWPMYAAMPAVLKAAIENAYRSCGWDLKKSVCKGGYRVFPTVHDVLGEFNGKMESTAFSEEVKGNYVGALSTRLESLCNGIYGEIFGGRNLTDEELFDSNVIIDLSRVGAAETKSMIMGMLVIRLQEYRMSGEAMNLPLKHVTVLEEAHHLLRRTSTAQSEDGSNLLGKSVEMISTAIAEMRSYGEGFVIVDQSPGLMDMSVMRNTNTKIILRLPEAGDRDMVGNTMGLSSEQVYELSRLKTGVCAVYQKDWLEAVLCQVDRAEHDEVLYKFNPDVNSESRLRAHVIKALLAPLADCQTDEDSGLTAKCILECSVSGKLKIKILRELALTNPNIGHRKELVNELLELELELPDDLSIPAVADWYEELCRNTDLQDFWGKEMLPLVLKVRIEKLANQSAEWEEVQRLLPGEFALRNQELRQSRGRAFARICPLYCVEAPITYQQRRQLEEDYLLLKDSGEHDRALSDLLRAYLDGGIIRQKKQLGPYTDVAWSLMGGQDSWDKLFPLIQQNRLSEWDRSAREVLDLRVEADADTAMAILSLFLQSKGALPKVKESYMQWYRLALKQKMEA